MNIIKFINQIVDISYFKIINMSNNNMNMNNLGNVYQLNMNQYNNM
jgi:hypothetical protein